MRLTRVLVLVLGAALLVAGCGGSSDSSKNKETSNAKKAPAGDIATAKGKVNWCIGKDTSGAYGDAIALAKKKNPKLQVKLVELPEASDEQRTQLVQRLRAKSTECDVLGMDTIWTAEFAAQGWLSDASEVVKKRASEFIPSTIASPYLAASTSNGSISTG